MAETKPLPRYVVNGLQRLQAGPKLATAFDLRFLVNATHDELIEDVPFEEHRAKFGPLNVGLRSIRLTDAGRKALPAASSEEMK